MTEPITVNGAQKVQDELNDLVINKRQQVIQAIAEAREHGDLKENASNASCFIPMRQEKIFITIFLQFLIETFREFVTHFFC